jgi:hypothetical protein
MNRAFKTEYYPDMQEDSFGTKVATLSFAINNGKRFKSLTKSEKRHLAGLINAFQKQL